MMAPMRLSAVAPALEGVLLGDDALFTGISADSRRLAPKQLFVALSGPSFDGHDFLEQAASSGAAAALVSQPSSSSGLACLQVADTGEAIGRLAALNRQLFKGPVVGITGSAGKTTCKDLCAAILGQQGAVLATEKNFNNEVGVPLTLLSLSPKHRAAVVEMGASRRGDIARLADWVRPNVALITNAMPAHLEGFGDIRGVVQGKGEILDFVPEDGAAVLNADDPAAADWEARAGARRILRFGFAAGADCRPEAIEPAGTGLRFRLCTPLGDIPVEMRFSGAHNALNAAAAAAVAVALGTADLDDIRRGLEQQQPRSGRLQLLRSASPAVIDDSYNASPETLHAALQVLAGYPGRRLLILGEMAELGSEAEKYHREAGRIAREAGIDALIGCGPLPAAAVASFGERGRHFHDRQALLDSLEECAADFDAILVKGSRAAGMEQVAAALAEM